MKEEYAAPATDSPTQPSTWQLRFGKKSGRSSQNIPKTEAEIHPEHGNQVRSPSISEQLLRALNSSPKEQEDLSRECADVLLGRRNAFANAPELRLRTIDEHCGPLQDENNHDDVAAEAKKIIQVRFQLENQADALRQAPDHRKCPKQSARTQRIRSDTEKARHFSTNTRTRVHDTVPLFYDKKERTKADNQQPEVRNSSRSQRKQKLQRQSAATDSISAMPNSKSRSRLLPPQQLPMERRQQQLQQAREARKAKAAEEKVMLKLLESAPTDNNKDDIQEQRRLKAQIERLTLENRHAAIVEERIQHRKVRIQILGRVFRKWHQYVECRTEQEARVAAEFNWRVRKRIMTAWTRYTHRQIQKRVAQQARLKLVQDHQKTERAKQFHRSKCLPMWFYRWMTFLAQQKEHRAASEAAERRRAQTQRLMERLQRQKTLEKDRDSDNQAETSDTLDSEKGECDSRIRERSRKTLVSVPQHRRRTAWSEDTALGDKNEQTTESQHQEPPPLQSPGTTLVRTSRPVDKVYKAMEQRAVERKQRREELKKKYEELEQKKKQEQEEKREAREALLLQQRMEEKARVRERKAAEALALQEKQERREYLIAQRYKAKKHNRRRLLFYYALLPWRQYHALNERVAHNATRWYELRTVYSHWEHWQEFVRMCRKLRRRRERTQLEEAAKFYFRSLQRRTFRGLVRYHQATEARGVAVHRQNQWNTLQRTWTYWHKRLMDERAYQRQLVAEAMARMQKKKLRRICAQWLKVTNESKHRQEMEREKQQLWRKVRGWLDE
ncbi:hypothetical protein V7S43_017815 [Phytophthora oleae]|uniref:Sfi1 spindle body domain-containing protein n=1 Tax=Phytophthora oleae TaxID=2107226 RepID=A0ABD3EUF3_9STRA